MDVHGMNLLVQMQLMVVIYQFYNGVMHMGALGMNSLVQMQPLMEISQ
jgi:hypothetical protein